MRIARQICAISTLAILVVAAGCSGSGAETISTPQSEDLADVAGLLRDYTSEFKKGPSKLADTARFQPLYSRGYGAIKDGRVVVVWEVPMPTEGGGTEIVAYEKKAETEGGIVLLQNGELKKMTAQEFQAASKAK